MSDPTIKLGEILKKTDSKNANQLEKVPIELKSYIEAQNTESNLKSLPKTSMYSYLKTITLGDFLKSRNSLFFKTGPFGSAILGLPSQTLCFDMLKILGNVFV